MLILLTVWWLLFFCAFGLCVGSFLNVVIYRLPAGLALSRPTWSFCPQCLNPVAWYDNLPVISYLRLAGRCRNCWRPISSRYPIVEMITALMVLVLVDAFFFPRTAATGFDGGAITWRIADGWPIFLAHVILFAALTAMSAIDLQFYWVDIRFTHLAAACGFVLHMIPVGADVFGRRVPLDATSVSAAAALIAFVPIWWLVNRRATASEDQECEVLHEFEAQPPANENRATPFRPYRPMLPALAVLVFVLIALTMDTASGETPVSHVLRAGVPLAFFVVMILVDASRPRPSDDEIVDAIEAEAPGIRLRTLAELGTMVPSIIAAAVVLILYQRSESFQTGVADLLDWTPRAGWQPLTGLGTAAAGYVIAAGIGWSVRILSNLSFGKEAFATGDIHMMAAAGAVAGWQVVVLGFVLTCFLASLGWAALLPFKRGRAIPLGPWLTIGFLITTVFYESLVNTQLVRNVVTVSEMLFFSNSQ